LHLRTWLDTEPPRTILATSVREFNSSGDVAVSWRGVDPWNRTIANEIDFSYRVDDGEWSPFARRSSVVLGGIESGRHRIEVRARDALLNVEPVPAELHFVVVPPFWMNAAVQCALAVVAFALLLQCARLVRRTRRRIETERREVA
jgi:hypothetical protein